MRLASHLRPCVLGACALTLLLSGCSQNPVASDPSSTRTESPASATAVPSASWSPLPSHSASPSPSDARDQVDVGFVTLDVIDGALEATAIVLGANDDSAVCTLTADGPSGTRTTSTDATHGPESTYCGLLTLPASELAPGDWIVSIAFESVSAVGRTPERMVQVP